MVTLRRFAGDFDRDFEPFVRQQLGHAVGPFDERQAVGVEIFVRAEGEELVFVLEAVRVEVVDAAAGRRGIR